MYANKEMGQETRNLERVGCCTCVRRFRLMVKQPRKSFSARSFIFDRFGAVISYILNIFITIFSGKIVTIYRSTVINKNN